MIATVDQRGSPLSVVGRKRDYISHSAIATYQQCPLRYRFKYIDGLPETVVSSALIFGGAIHSALEFHFTDRLFGNEPPSLDQLLDVFQEAWRGRTVEHQDIRFGKGEDHNSLSALADRMLTAFRESPAVTSEDTVIGIEEELRGELIPGVPDLLARIDLLTTTSDALVITDFKTARSRWSQGQAENSSSQLVLTKTKKPTVESFDVDVSQHRVHRITKAVEHTWRAIEAGHFYPAPSPMNCPTCPFRSECNAWTGD
jgi:putative RecB family exonuclease